MSFFRAVFSVKEETEAPKDTTTSESRRVGLAAIDWSKGGWGKRLCLLCISLLLARNESCGTPPSNLWDEREEKNSKNARIANHEFYLFRFTACTFLHFPPPFLIDCVPVLGCNTLIPVHCGFDGLVRFLRWMVHQQRIFLRVSFRSYLYKLVLLPLWSVSSVRRPPSRRIPPPLPSASSRCWPLSHAV